MTRRESFLNLLWLFGFGSVVSYLKPSALHQKILRWFGSWWKAFMFDPRRLRKSWAVSLRIENLLSECTVRKAGFYWLHTSPRLSATPAGFSVLNTNSENYLLRTAIFSFVLSRSFRMYGFWELWVSLENIQNSSKHSCQKYSTYAIKLLENLLFDQGSDWNFVVLSRTASNDFYGLK